jgi:CheY-like chemotaxis protein
METLTADLGILCGIAHVLSDRDEFQGTGSAQPESESSAQRKQRVLVVDDQPAIRELIAMYLEDENYEVQEAGSGPEALLRFTSRPKWDLIITDRMMPEMSGDELAVCIRRFDRTVPIILVSGYTAEGMGSFEFDAVVSKPFTKDNLLDAIQKLPS